MVEILFDDNFKKLFLNLNDKLLKTKIIKQIEKIKINPKVGKPMKNIRKGTRELYIKPYRLSYKYYIDKNIVEILDLYHKDEQ